MTSSHWAAISSTRRVPGTTAHASRAPSGASPTRHHHPRPSARVNGWFPGLEPSLRRFGVESPRSLQRFPAPEGGWPCREPPSRRRAGTGNRRSRLASPHLGASGRSAVHEKRRVAPLCGRLEEQPLLAVGSNQRRQFQQARSRLAVQDRQPRTASRIQARRNADRREGRSLHDRWDATGCRGPRCQNRQS